MTAATRSSSRNAGDASHAANELRLSVEQVSYAHAPNPQQAPIFTLEATSFQVKAGEVVAILGPNASGKSTLLQIISGALQPLSGRVLLNGFVTHDLEPRVRGQRIAMVQQESQLLFPSKAWEFVMQGRHPYGKSLRFETDDDVIIAKNALAQQPLLLLLDEPTLHLDIGAQVDLLETLHRLARENRYSVVVVTHELNLVGEYADQVVLLQKGKCLRVGAPAAVYQRDLLEQVFQTQLSVEMGSNGRPRVIILPGT